MFDKISFYICDDDGERLSSLLLLREIGSFLFDNNLVSSSTAYDVFNWLTHAEELTHYDIGNYTIYACSSCCIPL